MAIFIIIVIELLYFVPPYISYTLIIIPLILFLSIIMFAVLYYMPNHCVIDNDGGVVKLCSLVRCRVFRLRDVLGVVRGGWLPPGGTKALFCFGWRMLTFWSDCGDEIFFSTPSCRGEWMRLSVVDERGVERVLWLCG